MCFSTLLLFVYYIKSLVCLFIDVFFLFVLLLLSPSQPIIIPDVAHEGDPSNFEAYPEEKRKKDPAVSPRDLEIFKNF